MNTAFKIYQKLLHRYPVGMQAIQAGLLMAIGDQVAQNMIERRNIANLDFVRTSHFACVGFFIGGPATRTWYGILDKYIGTKGGSVAVRKVMCDQLLFAPTFLAILLVTLGLLQGNNLDMVKLRLKNDYFEILENNYKVWPMVQIANFYFVPLQYQALVVQMVALLWNTYISYRTNLDNRK